MIRAVRRDAASAMVATAKAHVRCIPWSAQNAARIPRFRSSPVATALFTAAIASTNSGHPYGQAGKAHAIILEEAIIAFFIPSAGSRLLPSKSANI